MHRHHPHRVIRQRRRDHGQALFETWRKHAGNLDEDDTAAAEQAMLDALDDTRQSVLNLIEQLR